MIIKKILRRADRIIFKRDRINLKKLIDYQEDYKNNLKTRPKEINTVSVIIPCYNHSKYLVDALNSVMYQTRVPDEIVLIDDNSTDNTFEILKNFYTEHNAKFNIVLKKNTTNMGQCFTINKGVTLANSELIMILNDDDYLMHDAIENTLKIFNQENDIYLLGSKSIYVYRQEHFENLNKFTFGSLNKNEFIIRKIFPFEVEKFITGREIDMAHSGSSFLKVAWETVGGYISKINRRVIIFSDRDFQLRVNSAYPIAIVENAAFAFWRINSSVDQGVFS